MREGQKWFYEISEFFSNFLPADQIAYMGFERVNLRDYSALAGVFEFPSWFKFDNTFLESIKGYSSDRVQFLVAYESINRYNHCVIVLLRG